MKRIVFSLFLFVVGLWLTEGQQTTERPLVTNGLPESSEPLNDEQLSVDGDDQGVNVTESEDEDDEGLSVDGDDQGVNVTESEDEDDEGLSVDGDDQGVNVTESDEDESEGLVGGEDDSVIGNSTIGGESLAVVTTRRTCLKWCYVTVSYKRTRRDICSWNSIKTCIKYSLSYRRVRKMCRRCCKGWTGTPGNCRDINECRGKNPCGRNGKCRNTPGSYRCYCRKGYYFNGRTCIPGQNPCKWNPCGKHGRCYITGKSYGCSCNRGFHFDGTTCVDINECERRGICQQKCKNTIGSYNCVCRNGYEVFRNRWCVDIDECKCNNGGCPFPHRCINTPGSHYCECPFGFRPRGGRCYRVLPQNKLNFTLPNNPSVIPRVTLPTPAP